MFIHGFLFIARKVCSCTVDPAISYVALREIGETNCRTFCPTLTSRSANNYAENSLRENHALQSSSGSPAAFGPPQLSDCNLHRDTIQQEKNNIVAPLTIISFCQPTQCLCVNIVLYVPLKGDTTQQRVCGYADVV